jgi:hypothetical protein
MLREEIVQWRAKATMGLEAIGQLLEALGDYYEPTTDSVVPSFESGRSDCGRLGP